MFYYNRTNTAFWMYSDVLNVSDFSRKYIKCVWMYLALVISWWCPNLFRCLWWIRWIDDDFDAADAPFLGRLSEKYGRIDIQRGTAWGRSSMLDVWPNPGQSDHSTTLWVPRRFGFQLSSLRFTLWLSSNQSFLQLSKCIWCIHCIFCIRWIRFEGPWKLVWLLSLTAWSLKSRLPGWL